MELSKCESLYKLRYEVQETHRHRLYMSLSVCGYQNGQILVCCTQSPYPKIAMSDSDQFNSLIDELERVEPTVDVGKGRQRDYKYEYSDE